MKIFINFYFFIMEMMLIIPIIPLLIYPICYWLRFYLYQMFTGNAFPHEFNSEVAIIGFIWIGIIYPIGSVLLFSLMLVISIFSKQVRKIRRFTQYLPLINLIFLGICCVFLSVFHFSNFINNFLLSSIMLFYTVYIFKRWKDEIKQIKKIV